jgi:hypothetical protein
MADAAVGSEVAKAGSAMADMVSVDVNGSSGVEMETGGVAVTSGAPGGRTDIGNVSGGEYMAVMGAAGRDMATGNGSATTDSSTQTCSSKGQMTGWTAGTNKAGGRGGRCSVGVIGRARGEGGGDGGTSRP